MKTLSAASRKEAIIAAVKSARKGFLGDLQQRQISLIDLYHRAAFEIQHQIALYSDSDGSITFQRLDALLQDIRKTIGSMSSIRDKQLDSGIASAARIGIETYRRPLEIAGRSTGQLSAVFGKVHRETLEAVHDFIAADGLQLSDRLYRLDLGAKETVSQIIQKAVVTGESSRESAQKLIRKGETVPKETLTGMTANKSSNIAGDVGAVFTPEGEQNIVHNALRLFRTEIARANNEGFLRTGKNISSVVGNRWNLSASHPKTDICDTYATQDIDGLGPGGYKTDNYPSHSHPECLCFPTPIFDFEVEEE